MADVNTGVSTNRMLDQHYTPMAHRLQFVWSRVFDGITSIGVDRTPRSALPNPSQMPAMVAHNPSDGNTFRSDRTGSRHALGCEPAD